MATEDFIDELELSVRAVNVLRNNGITSEVDFMKLDRSTFTSFKAAGIKTWKEIAELQASHRQTIRWRKRERLIVRAAMLLRDLNEIREQLHNEQLFITKDQRGNFRLGRFVTREDFEDA